LVSVYYEYAGDRPSSGDCLFLNVWAPSENGDGKRPVMVWIYGGGFQQGSAANPVFDGARLAARGTIVVSLNYRVGIFGFMAHPDLSAESDLVFSTKAVLVVPANPQASDWKASHRRRAPSRWSG
jgi:para-nitrobenzyl esterase